MNSNVIIAEVEALEVEVCFQALNKELQLLITNFRGVITDISTQFVEITIEGNMFLDNIVDTQTEVRDVASNCDG